MAVTLACIVVHDVAERRCTDSSLWMLEDVGPRYCHILRLDVLVLCRLGVWLCGHV